MQIEHIQKQILLGKPLQIIGNNSQLQSDYPNTLDMSCYTGLIGYHPEELVITVKAGTKLKDIESILSHKDQVLPFVIDDNEYATIGGAYAMGSAQLRDAVLGIRIIDGRGQILNFGGQVMKNVAGYDVARLLVGSRGKLAVICEISLRVLPKAYALSVTPSIPANEPSSALLKQRIEQGLKQVFDPNGIFV